MTFAKNASVLKELPIVSFMWRNCARGEYWATEVGEPEMIAAALLVGKVGILMLDGTGNTFRNVKGCVSDTPSLNPRL